jgi:acyl-CoA thioesterase FadM
LDIGFSNFVCETILMNMFFRLIRIYLRARWSSPRDPLRTSRLTFIVSPTDLDIFRHMNNGVYFSIMDLGRVDMLVRSGLLDAIRSSGHGVTVAAETLRFRRSLTLFQRYRLETRLLGWDEKALVIEQRFFSWSRPKETWEVAAEGVVRARLVAKDGAQPSTSFLRDFGPEYEMSPALPSYVAEWNENQCDVRRNQRWPVAATPILNEKQAQPE